MCIRVSFEEGLLAGRITPSCFKKQILKNEGQI